MAPPPPLWGWTVPVRVLLTVVAGVLAIGLLAVARPDGGPPPEPVPDLVVDPNTAPPEVLMALPRLGPVLVGRIVAARREAPFASLEDLDARVRGIGPATMAALTPYLHIEPGPVASEDRPLPRTTPQAPP
jgi:competence protein ComEA